MVVISRYYRTPVVTVFWSVTQTEARSMKCKRVLITADWHTGHRAGLTPPKYYSGGREWVNYQSQKWEWFKDEISKHKWDCHVNMGDIIDGPGVKDSSETIMDLNSEISAAIEIVETISAPVNWFVYGTRVHTVSKDGIELDLEVAKYINGKDDPQIAGQLWLEYDKWILDCRHAPSSRSGVPLTRANPLIKERLSNVAWHAEGVQPLATHYFRAHQHYMFDCGEPGRWSAYSCPALQSAATKYGRILSNVVHCGIGYLEIPDNGDWPIWKVKEAPKEIYTTSKLFK
jgi:hypothetical protein